MKKSLAFVALGVLLLAAGAAVACDKSSTDSATKDRISALETQVAQAHVAAQNTQMTLALEAIAGAGLHGIDETANDDNKIVAGAAGPVQRAITAIAAVEWPAGLQAGAQEVQEALEALHEALGTDDVEQVKGPAAAAHEATHEFTEGVDAALAASLGLPADGHEDETTPAETTPGATAEAH